MKKCHIVIALGIVSVLFGSLFFIHIILAQNGDDRYDPWLDYNDDGVIDGFDFTMMAKAYGSSGEPINKTDLLLELQSRVDSLSASLIELQGQVSNIENLSFVKVDDYIIEKDGATFKAVDGKTDQVAYSSTGLVATIQWAHDQLSYGGSIAIKSDVYAKEWESKLAISNDGITLHGASFGFTGKGTFLQAKDGLDDYMIDVSGDSFRLYNMHLDGNRRNQTTGTGIRIQGKRAHVNDVKVWNMRQYGIYWAGALGVAYGVHVSLTTNAGWLISSEQCVFSHCWAQNSDRQGWYIRGPKNLFLGCRARDNGWHGFHLCGSQVILNHFVGCQAHANVRHGFFLEGASRNVFDVIAYDNSREENNMYDGIHLASHGTTHSMRNAIKAVIYNGATIGVSCQQRYGIRENDANQDYNLVASGSIVTDNVTGQISLQGAHSKKSADVIEA